MHTHPGNGGPWAANVGSWRSAAVPTVHCLCCGTDGEHVISAGSVPGIWNTCGYKSKVLQV